MSEDLKTHICRQCQQVDKPIGFRTERSLSKHLRDVHGPRLQCPYCNYTYAQSREDNLRRHINIRHSFNPPIRVTEMDTRIVVESGTGVDDTAETARDQQQQSEEGPLDLSVKSRGETSPGDSTVTETQHVDQGEQQHRPTVRSIVVQPFRPLSEKTTESKSSSTPSKASPRPKSSKSSTQSASKTSDKSGSPSRLSPQKHKLSSSTARHSTEKSRSPARSSTKTHDPPSSTARPSTEKSRSPSKSSSKTSHKPSSTATATTGKSHSPSRQSSNKQHRPSSSSARASTEKSHTPSRSSSKKQLDQSSSTARPSTEKSHSPTKSSSKTSSSTAKSSRKKSHSPSKSSSKTSSSTAKSSTKKSHSPSKSSSKTSSSTAKSTAEKSHSPSRSSSKKHHSPSSSTARASTGKSRSPSKSSVSKSKTAEKPRSPQKSLSQDQSKGQLCQEKTSTPLPNRQEKAPVSGPKTPKEPQEESNRPEGTNVGQKRPADSEVESNLPAKFARQRTLSESSTESSASGSSAASGSAAASGSSYSSGSSASFTGMEDDDIHLSPVPDRISPLNPDGCPTSPGRSQVENSEMPSTDARTTQGHEGQHGTSTSQARTQDGDVSHEKGATLIEEVQDQSDQQGPSIQQVHTQDTDVPRQESVVEPDGDDSAVRGSKEGVPKGGFIPLFSSIDKEIQTRRAAVLTQLQQLDNSAANKDFGTPASPQLTVERQPPSFSLRQSMALGDSTTNWNRVDLSPVSEYDPGNGPSDRPVYIPTGTPYLPQPHNVEKKTCYEAVAADPRTAFSGAPSLEMNSGVASFLRRVRRMTLTNGRRRVRTYFPEGCACMVKKEEAILPNGTTYKITTTWVKEPQEEINEAGEN